MDASNQSSKVEESLQFDSVQVEDDLAIYSEHSLRIHAAVDMPDWQVRQFRRIVVVFRGNHFYIADKRSLPNGTIQYLLKPWKDTKEIPGKIIYYDADYVRNRNESNRLYQRRKYQFMFLRLAYPLIGFLWSRTKAQLEREYWISARRATLCSVLPELACSLVAGVLLVITTVVAAYFAAAARTAVLVFDPFKLIMLLAITAPDGIVRLHHLLEDSYRHYGFFEWLFRLPRKKEKNL